MVEVFNHPASAFTRASSFGAEPAYPPIVLSECRALVSTNESSGYYTDALTRHFDSYTFRLLPASVWFVPTSDKRKANSKESGAHDESLLPTEYGTVVYDYSPLDFFLVPKRATRLRAHVTAMLNSDEYKENTPKLTDMHMEVFGQLRLWEGMPCVAPDRVQGKPYDNPTIVREDDASVVLRRCVLSECDVSRFEEEDAQLVRVTYVDCGHSAWVGVDALRPLPIRLRAAPITAVHCRLSGILRDDVYQHKMVEFRDMLTKMKHVIRVQVVEDGGLGVPQPQPYIVHAFHPTAHNQNLAIAFRKPEHPKNAPRKKDPPCIRIARGEDPEGDTFSNGCDDEETNDRSEHVLRYGKIGKPELALASCPNVFTSVIITHVHHAKAIYALPTMRRDQLICMEIALLEHYSEHLTYGRRRPEAWADGDACVVLVGHEQVPCVREVHTHCGGKRWVRGVVRQPDLATCSSVDVDCIDYGTPLTIARTAMTNDVRVVNEIGAQAPYGFICKLDGLADLPVHVTHSNILREIIGYKNGKHVCVRLIAWTTARKQRQSQAQVPTRVRLLLDEKSVYDMLMETAFKKYHCTYGTPGSADTAVQLRDKGVSPALVLLRRLLTEKIHLDVGHHPYIILSKHVTKGNLEMGLWPDVKLGID